MFKLYKEMQFFKDTSKLPSLTKRIVFNTTDIVAVMFKGANSMVVVFNDGQTLELPNICDQSEQMVFNWLNDTLTNTLTRVIDVPVELEHRYTNGYYLNEQDR